MFLGFGAMLAEEDEEEINMLSQEEIARENTEANTEMIGNILKMQRWPKLSRLEISAREVDYRKIIEWVEIYLPTVWEFKCILTQDKILTVVEQITASNSSSSMRTNSGIRSLILVAMNQGKFIGSDANKADEMNETDSLVAQAMSRNDGKFRFLDFSFYVNLELLEAIQRYQQKLLGLSIRVFNSSLEQLRGTEGFSVTVLKLHCVVFEDVEQILALRPKMFPNLRRLSIENLAIFQHVGYDSKWIERPFIGMFKKGWPGLRSLELPYLSDEMIHSIANNCPNLIYLKGGTGCNCFFSNRIWPLESELLLSNTGVHYIMNNLQHLRYLDINTHHAIIHNIDDMLFQEPEATLDQLQNTYADAKRNPSSGYSWSCRELFKLRLGNYHIPAKLLERLFDQAPKLEDFETLLDDHITNSKVLEEMKPQESVRKLAIKNEMNQLDSERIIQLIQKFPNVRHITMQGLHRFTAAKAMKGLYPDIKFKNSNL